MHMQKASKRAMIGVIPEHKSYLFRKPLGFSRGSAEQRKQEQPLQGNLFQNAAML